ncbi:MAG: hypothetical protein ACIRZ2_08810, partial [Ligilactobacillus ruminis]
HLALFFYQFTPLYGHNLKSYGQTAVFDHFVRNRHFWNSPFTDSIPIFIDASVNNSDFAKCIAARQLLNRCT